MKNLLVSSKMNARSLTLVIVIVAALTISIFVPLYSASFMKNPKSASSSMSLDSTAVSNVSSLDPPNYSTTKTTSPNGLKIAIPLYSESLNDWFQVLNSTPTTGIVVLNVNYGPGNAYNPTYAWIASLAQKSGTHVLGYVYTNYADGSIPVSQVEQWINDWYNWYHVDGIFFDEVRSTCTNQSISYYSTLYNYTKSEPGSDVVVLNPGNTIGECYAPISDILVTFEGNYADYLTNYNNTTWMRNYPPSHFWNIVYNATTVIEMQTAVDLATLRGTGWIYVSDGLALGVNSLGRLPIYFCREIQFLGPVSGSCDVINNATSS